MIMELETIYNHYEKIGDILYNDGRYSQAERAYRKALVEMKIQDFKVKHYVQIQKKIIKTLKKLQVV
jgi:predicted negative regulator of RcsB-dependent stress response